MFNCFKIPTALLVSAVFVYSPQALSQAPIVDASLDSKAANQPVAPAPAAGINQGELFYQLQILQQEVMQLRGTLEEQAYQIKQLKEKGMERYIDLDRRLGQVASYPSTAGAAQSSRSGTTQAAEAPAIAVVQQGEKQAYDAAYGLVIQKRFDDALEAFKRFLVDYPDGKYAPNSYYWMGELYQVIAPQDLDAAREAFSQLLGQYPDHAKAADAMYKLGKVYFLRGNRVQARKWLEKTIADYSNGANASAADKARQFISSNF